MTRRASQAVVWLIETYRHMISPLHPPACRFTPTCSQYAADALREFGLLRGGCYAVARLLRCGPWHRGGWDPIPERRPPTIVRRSAGARATEDAEPREKSQTSV